MQMSLLSSRHYYFELLHKQDDHGSDHVEVGWRVFLPSFKFEVVDSPYISLYTDESSLKMNEVEHVPQSLASYAGSYLWGTQRDEHGADMLKPDPRDTFFLTPQIEPSHVENVLVPCAYSPTYVVKDFPIARYQGLQFVYLSFVYPNDFTRLTHMETENKCFYRESPLYLEKFGFYKYMKMDEEEEDLHQRAFLFLNPENFLEEEEEGADSPEPTDPLPDTKDRSPTTLDPRMFPEPQRQERPVTTKEYGGGVGYYAFHQKQKRFHEEGALIGQPVTTGTQSGPSLSPVTSSKGSHAYDNAAALGEQGVLRRRSLSWAQNEENVENGQKAGEMGMLPQPKSGSSLNLHPHLPVSFFSGKAKQQSPKEEKQPTKENKKPPEKVYVTRLQPGKKKAPPQKDTFPGVFLYPKPPRKVQLNSRSPQRRPAPSNKFHSIPGRRTPWLMGNISRETDSSKRKKERANRKWEQLYDQEISKTKMKHNVQPSVLSVPAEGLFSKENFDVSTPARVTLDYNSSETVLSEGVRVTSFLRMSEMTESQQEEAEGPEKAQEEEVEEEELSDYSYENSELQQSWLEDSINWQRTFSVSPVDFELLRSDWNDLRCNVSGNLQLSESEVVDVVAQYMEKLNEKNGGIYTLLRIVNVEKRRDTARGNRYLVELELMERGQRTVRLSEYIYVLLHQGKSEDSTEVNPEGPATASTESQPPPSAWSLLYGKPILCRPQQLNWRRDVTVHFVVPVKNQARWVQQFISDMASLYLNTKDANFNIILVDFDSDDMDVEKALQEAHLPRYQYLKRGGNFERSAGLQVGVDSIEDGSSIVFLCDLHIHFPLNILDSIRKHCVEGKLAYAPIVMRLGCGSSPQEPNGYWEVNGFGLFGIYKSDFDRIGGMNTEEFRDRWGGEDWELLDRVLQSGLEVERLRLRNFYHYYHSKRGMWNSRNKKTPKD
ncbi:PREDICTED: N-acetyl-beta-glucosaminyl-glycoprotein 4-beta-N-acetylgalactosaminyltransferase 1-like [Gekko japonicus]|uniref:Hexosyltransferase n=1 Tax=Gekko japonicus TaxID=146911 RepID=A0ABM1JS45_GEKJA|nr:PREDICTED: N-acetyl-beta-glucosaminyl-glycoprotein 4-beta-N-acetylgalactosaminyltransferase 1-like [Gekko japonicus]